MKKKSLLILLLVLFSELSFSQEWSLDSCLNYALHNNMDIIAKCKNISIATFDSKKAKTELLPQIKLIGNMDYYWKLPVQSYPGELLGKDEGTTVAIPIGNTWVTDYGLEAKVKLFDMKAIQDIKLTSLKKQASKYAAMSVVKLIQKNVTMAYFSILVQKEDLDIALENCKEYDKIHNVIAQKFEEGLIDKIIFNQSLVIRKEYENNCKRKEADLQYCKIDLKYWIGYSLEKEINIQRINIPIFSTINNFDITCLPDYQEKMALVQIAEQQYRSTKSSFYPKLSLMANFDNMGFSDDFKLLNKSSNWYQSGFLGLRLSLPIIQLNKIYTVKRQKAYLNQKRVEVNQYQEEQQKAFISAKINIAKYWRDMQSAQEILALSIENEQLNMQKICEGVIDVTQLRQTQNELIDAQKKLILSKLNYVKYVVELNYLQSNKS